MSKIKEIMVWGENSRLSGHLAFRLKEAARPSVLADYDLGNPLMSSRVDFSSCRAEETSGNRAWIDVRKCIHCGTCEVRCPSASIHDLKVYPQECRGCGTCISLCAAEAISLRCDIRIRWEIYRDSSGVLIRAPAGPFPDITTAVIKQEGLKYTQLLQREILISRGPSILDDSLYTSLDSVKLVVAAIDPAVTDLARLKRILHICQQFRIPTVACLIGVGIETPGQIEKWRNKLEIEIITCLRLDENSGDGPDRLWKDIQGLIV
ncbi:MAG TPA: 4Fe-4S binding protein [Dehalococcoidales bacterium]|nr:4Fe-4S binding protein [Dehalococcoidales bacterium]